MSEELNLAQTTLYKRSIPALGMGDGGARYHSLFLQMNTREKILFAVAHYSLQVR